MDSVMMPYVWYEGLPCDASTFRYCMNNTDFKTQCEHHGVFTRGPPASGRCAREFRFFQLFGREMSLHDPQAMLEEALDRNIPEAVRLLLQDSRVDPSADDNLAIWRASYYGHAEVVRLLLADPRVDPSALNNMAIRFAIQKGHAEVVRLLLADPRVNPSADYNEAIKNAIQKGHVEVVRLLLADPRANPSADYNEAIKNAIQNGHVEVVRLLMEDGRTVGL